MGAAVADTLTVNFSFTKPEVGASSDTWGNKWNTNLDSIDTLIFARMPKAGGAFTGGITGTTASFSGTLGSTGAFTGGSTGSFAGALTVSAGGAAITGNMGVAGIISSNGNAVWHAGNFAPSLYAALASPAFTGTPTAPTAAGGTNTTQLATTAFVSTAVANLINGAPGALDTLVELGAALGNDPNFETTITNALAGKQASLGFTPYNATNPSGFISGINSSMVTTALGFTPYSNANPSAFISGINSGMVTTALGFTPANKAGDTFSGTFGRDANFHFSLNGSNPRITLDAGDYIEYDRSTNKLTLYIGSAAVFSISSAGFVKAANDVQGFTAP